MNRSRKIRVSGCLAVLLATMAWADYKDDVGFSRLAAELGGALPAGVGISLTQVEGSADYMPDASHPEFASKTLVNASGLSTNVSAHATTVGQFFFGSSTSLSPGADGIDAYEADDWLGDGFLRAGTGAEPLIETNRIQNHSWIGDSAGATNALRRLDYAIARDGFTAVVGLNNGSGSVVPGYLAHSYNAISVGRSDGEHSRGGTTFEVAGRVKPEIVAPLSATSWSTPLVGSAAALLLEKALGSPSLTQAIKPECIKAILLAGATKDEFPDWDRTETRPLDEVYGAGELNVYNSYQVLVAGEQEASVTSEVACMGWDYASIGAATNRYFFTVPAGHAMTRLSVILTWNRLIIDGPGAGFEPQASLPDLGLHLYQAEGFTRGGRLDVSTSGVDNVEHVYCRNLPEGQYALEVTSDAASDYALAWYSQVARVPETTGMAWLDGGLELRSIVSSNTPYAIEAATNLVMSNAWTRLATNRSTSNVLVYVDGNSSNFVQRFYRLVADP